MLQVRSPRSLPAIIPDNGTQAYSTFIHQSRYARWLDGESRRETWGETVARFFDFFVDKHRGLASQIADSLPAVLAMDVMPSMRALWATKGRRVSQSPSTKAARMKISRAALGSTLPKFTRRLL